VDGIDIVIAAWSRGFYRVFRRYVRLGVAFAPRSRSICGSLLTSIAIAGI
jgi:hypothetical protein